MSKKTLMTKNGIKLIGKVVTEGSMQRVAVQVYQISKSGEISVPNIFQRSELLKKSKALQELLNLSICLTEEELDEVIAKAVTMLESPDKVEEAENIDTMSTPSQLYKAICEYGQYITSNPIIPQTEEETKQMVWVDKDVLNIRTSDFADFLKDIPEADGYKKIEILKCLKLLGALETDAGRAYDKKVSRDNQKFNCYRIQMPVTKNHPPKAEDTKVEHTHTVSKNEKPVDEESVDDWYKQFK